MTIRIDDAGVIHLLGECGIDDAEPLRERLSGFPASPVQWEGCERLHTAVLQVLLAAAPACHGIPKDPFLSEHVAPLLRKPPLSQSG